jgi:Outer membrane lipoprotein-sorting protein
VRRITGAEAQESFVGSDFTYEDIGGREFDEYTFRLLEKEDSWTAPGGERLSAYRLESRRKDPSSRYPRVVSLVLKDSFVVVHSDIYNRRDEKEKAYDVRRLERVEGIWTAFESAIANDLDGTRTELIVDDVDYNVGLQLDDVSRRELERGAR